MPAISFIISQGGTLESVTAGTAAPTSGSVEIRIDQTATAITDAQSPTGTRALKRGEIYTLLQILEARVSVDSTLIP